ncbi:hypothetical protein [Fluviicola taffensis]|uniref:hypothetical protein n=1 Tax=Fluviicola taffensis TaxID=191579 RepID=UPI003137AB50
MIELQRSFRSSRGHVLQKRLSSIIDPNNGLSWDKKVLKEIVETLDELKVSENNASPRGFWEYIYD